MRNIDKIKEMESEELVEFIMEKFINDKCEACIFNPNECKGNCREGMEKWFDAISLSETQLSKEELAVLEYCENTCCYIKKENSYLKCYGYKEEGDDWDEPVCKITIEDKNLFEWMPDRARFDVSELLKIKQVEKTKKEKNIETNETLYKLIETCRNKLLKIRVTKGKSKCRPIKNTRREDVYEVVWDLMNLFQTFGLKSSYEVMKELQRGEVHRKGE